MLIVGLHKTMLAFEIYQNGKRICTAGTGEVPVINVLVCTSSAPGEEGVRLVVGGMKGEEHVSWHNGPVGQGSEVCVKVVETAAVDEPLRQYRYESPPTPEEELNQMKNYVRLAAAQLGWRIQE